MNTQTAQRVEIRTLRSLPELEQIRSYWEAWPGNRDSDPDFYVTVLRASPESVRPHVIVIYRDGRPDAMLFGRIDCRGFDHFRLGYFKISPKLNILYFVYGALRGNSSPENCNLLIREVCNALSQGEADLAYLNFLRRDSAIYKSAKTLPGFLWRDHVRASQLHYTRKLARSADDFRRELSPKLRKNQRWKKLEHDWRDNLTIRCLRNVTDLDVLMRDAEVVMKNSYQRGLGVGFRDTMEERERLQLKAEKGWLRAYILYLADRPCAFWIGDINQGVFGSDYLAFDPSFAKYSPGLYLSLKVIEGFCGVNGELLTEVDFATGHAEYKEALSNQKFDETLFIVFAPTLKGFALNLFRTATGRTDAAVKRLLDETGLLPKIKRVWRARLRHSSEVRLKQGSS